MMSLDDEVENLDEFDEPSRMGTAFCQQMTEEQFEQQASKETEQALQSLMKFIDQNPLVYMDVLKKRKQEDIESQGMLSFIKARVMSIVQGDNYTGNEIPAMEFMHQKDQLKTGIKRAFHYGQDAKGKRYSKRLAARKHVNDENESPKITAKRPKTDMAQSPPRISMAPPPAPPLPCLTPLRERNSKVNTPASYRRPLKKSSWKGSTSSISSVCSIESVHSELLSSNQVHRLKSTKNIAKSPGGTPCQRYRRSFSEKEPLERVLLTVMQQKFRNIRTPSPASGTLYNNVISPASAFSPVSSPY